MKIAIEVSEETEMTHAPYWLIVSSLEVHAEWAGKFINPRDVAFATKGPFFSREEAERELAGRRYNYGKDAEVWCLSGYGTGQYEAAYMKARNGLVRGGIVETDVTCPVCDLTKSPGDETCGDESCVMQMADQRNFFEPETRADLVRMLQTVIEPCRHRTTDDGHIATIEAVIAKLAVKP